MLRFVFSALLFGFVFSAHSQVDVQHYKFTINLSDADDEISGVADIRIRFTQPVQEFRLDLNNAKPDKKGMKAVVTAPNVSSQTSEENALVVRLKAPAAVDSSYDFRVSYSGIPRDGLIISRNKYGERTFFADNWPNRAHNWIPCVDRPDDKASFEFIVTAPSHYRVISNGILVEEKATADGRKLTHWKEDIPSPTKVMVIGVARFAVKEYEHAPAEAPVSAWVYPTDSAKGFYDYGLAPEILRFFSGYIAPYPYKKLANVQSKTIFGGMENASAIFYAESSVKGDRSSEDLLAHEIAHQWFGDMASEKSFAHLWLSEGFATYFTNIYFEKKYGKEKLAERQEEDREQIIAFTKKVQKPVVDSTRNLMSLLNANSYQKGGWVLHMLRNEVGDQTFQEIIRAYYQEFKGRNADSRDFEAVAEKMSGKELTWFFDQWLYRPDIPVLKIESKIQNGEFFLYVKQKEAPFRFRLKIAVIAEDGGFTTEQFLVTEKESEFKIPVKGSSLHFSIDPDVTLLYELDK